MQRSTNQTRSKKSKKNQTHRLNRSWCEHHTSRLADPLRRLDDAARYIVHRGRAPDSDSTTSCTTPCDDGDARRPRADEVLFKQDAIQPASLDARPGLTLKTQRAQDDLLQCVMVWSHQHPSLNIESYSNYYRNSLKTRTWQPYRSFLSLGNPIGHHFGARGDVKLPQMSAHEPFERKTGNTDKLGKHGGTKVKGRTKVKTSSAEPTKERDTGRGRQTNKASQQRSLCASVSVPFISPLAGTASGTDAQRTEGPTNPSAETKKRASSKERDHLFRHFALSRLP